MGLTEMDAYRMTVAGNAGVRFTVTAKYQARHSESIAPIRMSVRYLIVMLELMGLTDMDAYRMTVAGNAGERSAVTAMHQWDHCESIAPICLTVRCVVVVLELMGVAEVDACGMTVAGNARVGSAVTAKCQERHSESIALIKKSAVWMFVMLMMVVCWLSGCLWTTATRGALDRSNLTAMHPRDDSESIAPIRKSVGWIFILLAEMEVGLDGCLWRAVARNIGERSTVTAMWPTEPTESIAPIRRSVRWISVMLEMMGFYGLDAYQRRW